MNNLNSTIIIWECSDGTDGTQISAIQEVYLEIGSTYRINKNFDHPVLEQYRYRLRRVITKTKCRLWKRAGEAGQILQIREL